MSGTNNSTARKKGIKFGKAQEEFIEFIRNKVKSDPSFFHEKNWRLTRPKGGKESSLTSGKKVSVDSYYIKPISCWVSHLSFPNHLPKCPYCEESKSIDVNAGLILPLFCLD